MKIDRVEVFPTRLPVSAALRTSRGTVAGAAEGAPHVFVKVTSDTGASGWGEARPSRRWSYETPESVVTTLRRYLAPALIGLPADDEAAVRRAMEGEIAPSVHTGQPIAKSAIDMALCDVASRAADQPVAAFLREHLGLPAGPMPERVALTYLVTASDPAEAAGQVEAGVAAGFEGFKVTIGLGPDRDAAILDAVSRSAAGAFLWADANQAYGLEKAIEVGRAAERLGIDVLEQPLPAAAIAAQVELCTALDVPVVLDESVFDLLQLEELLRLGALDGVVVKVGKMGGVRPAARCAARALEAGRLVLLGGLTESRLGLSAGAALAAALGLDRPADLNGLQVLAEDCVSEALPGLAAHWALPTGPGIGVEPDAEKVARLAIEGRGT